MKNAFMSSADGCILKAMDPLMKLPWSNEKTGLEAWLAIPAMSSQSGHLSSGRMSADIRSELMWSHTVMMKSK